MKRRSTATTIPGVSLIETLVYIAVVSIFMITVTSLFASISQIRNRNQVIDEVNQQGVQILQQMSQALKNTTVVNTPAIAATSTTLNLTTYTAAQNPTIFDLNTNKIRISENGVITVITSNRVNASNLSFRNLSSAGADGSIKISFTLSHVNPDNKGELSYSQNFYATVTVK